MPVELGPQIQKTDKVQRIGGVGLLPKPVTSAVSPDGSTATVQVLGGAGIGTGPETRPESTSDAMGRFTELSTTGSPLRPAVVRTSDAGNASDSGVLGYSPRNGSEAK